MHGKHGSMSKWITGAVAALALAGCGNEQCTKYGEHLADVVLKEAKAAGQPAAEDLRKTMASVQQAAANLDAAISDARPGLQNFSKSTLPEANRLVRDLRELSQSLKSVSERVNEEGIGGALGPEKLPDYNPGKRQ